MPFISSMHICTQCGREHMMVTRRSQRVRKENNLRNLWDIPLRLELCDDCSSSSSLEVKTLKDFEQYEEWSSSDYYERKFLTENEINQYWATRLIILGNWSHEHKEIADRNLRNHWRKLRNKESA